MWKVVEQVYLFHSSNFTFISYAGVPFDAACYQENAVLDSKVYVNTT